MANLDLHGAEAILVDDGVRSIATGDSSIIGVVGTAPQAAAGLPHHKPILFGGPRAANELDDGGTLKDAYMAAYAQGAKQVVAVIVPEAATEADTLANVTGDAGEGTGVHALAVSEGVTGLKPKILIAPGFTKPQANLEKSPVTDALVQLGNSTRAIVVADGPNTNEADAVRSRADWGADNLYLVDPGVTVFDTASASTVVRPASAYVAGVIAKTDIEKGFWW